MANDRAPRSFEDKPATRERVPLMIGLMGPSGGGKTYSALRLATGIQRVAGGDIFMIDTERRRVAAMVASPRRDIALLAHDLEGSGLIDECRGIDASDECDGASDGSACWRHERVWEIAERLVRSAARRAS